MRALKILFYSIITILVTGVAIGMFVDTNTVEGEGPRITTGLPVRGYNAVDVSGAWDVILIPGKDHEVSLEMEENLKQYARISVEGNTLHVDMEGRLSFSTEPRIIISAPEFRKIEVSGASELISQEPIEGSELIIDASGASEVRLEARVNQLTIDGAGASDIHLEGSASNLEADLSGSSDLYASGLSAGQASIDVSGASSATLDVRDHLKADASGASSVSYSGSPSVEQSSSGASSIRKR